MQQIPIEKVKRDNSNVWRYSSTLEKDLRKERFKPARPDPYTNEMAAERDNFQSSYDIIFSCDVDNFIRDYLTEREGRIFRTFLFGGRITQQDIADGVLITKQDKEGKTITRTASQSTIANELAAILKRFKEFYYD